MKRTELLNALTERCKELNVDADSVLPFVESHLGYEEPISFYIASEKVETMPDRLLGIAVLFQKHVFYFNLGKKGNQFVALKLASVDAAVEEESEGKLRFTLLAGGQIFTSLGVFMMVEKRGRAEELRSFIRSLISQAAKA